MNADNFLARCDKVRRTGEGRWVACCPAHADKTPSMSVRELADGRVLIHCFSGCHAEEILKAVGMEFAHLFPDSLDPHNTPGVSRAQAFPAADVLLALESEALLVAVAAANVANGVALTETDLRRVWIAHHRIEKARELALGKR